jgi:hypothetical protein
MLMRTATLTLLLALAGGTDRTAPAPAHHDHAPVVRRAHIVDDLEGCRVPPPSPAPPAACTDQGQP